MKKLIYILLLLSIACSTSGDNIENNSTFSIELLYNQTAVVDEVLEVRVSSNEPMKSLEISFDNFESSFTDFANLGNLVSRFFSFDQLGTNTVYFKIRNDEDVELIQTLNVTITRGNAVKIQSLKLNSFYNIGETWDSEFDDTDTNRLADVRFAILKRRLDVYDGTRNDSKSFSIRFLSQTRANEDNLNWDLQNEDLYVDIERLTPYIAFGDDDGGGLGQELIVDAPFERAIPILDYIGTNPDTIIVEESDVDLEYELGISW